jgi:hypothetical protein
MKPLDYKDYLITFDRHHWGIEAWAIPDHGETIRHKFIGYTKKEMIATMKSLIESEASK